MPKKLTDKQKMPYMPARFMRKQRPPPVIQPGIGRERKVGLLGSHGGIVDTPWWDPTWVLWGHFACRHYYQRTPDMYFDLHPFSMRVGPDRVRWRERMMKNRVPIWMLEKYEEIPASVEFPIDRLVAEFQPRGRNVFTNQASWMIALLMTQGVTKIGLFGINYGHEDERTIQRESLVYWMGRAEQAGIQFVLPKQSTIQQKPMELYGPESHTSDGQLKDCYIWSGKKMIQRADNEEVELTILGPGEDNPHPAKLDIDGEEQHTSRRPDRYFAKLKEKKNDRKKRAGKAPKS